MKIRKIKVKVKGFIPKSKAPKPIKRSIKYVTRK